MAVRRNRYLDHLYKIIEQAEKSGDSRIKQFAEFRAKQYEEADKLPPLPIEFDAFGNPITQEDL